MWRTTIASVSVLMISSILCSANARQHRSPELEYKTDESSEPSMDETVEFLDFQATNIKSRELNFSIGQPWILEVDVEKSKASYSLRCWGALIDPKVVLVGTRCDQHGMVDNATYVRVGNAEVKVASIIHQSKLKNDNKHNYVILVLSTPILHIDAVRLAQKSDRISAGSTCYSVSTFKNASSRRTVITGKNETKFIYTKRKSCDKPAPIDWFGMLVCPIQDYFGHPLKSSYVLASMAPTNHDKDPRECRPVYRKLGNSRRWIDNVLLKVERHGYQEDRVTTKRSKR